jgi:dynein heavy chain
MNYDKFFGVYNSENNDFKDGCVTKLFRDANADTSSKLKLIVFDGPIEATWVENLNSVLDDNRKLFFGNGESLPLSSKMRVVLEASDLSQCSPATVSRCGVVYMEDNEDIIPLKSHVNKWMKNLP